MMTEEQAVELGKRAVAAGWKWQPGAVDIRDGMRMTAAGSPLWHWVTAEGDSLDAYAPRRIRFPDFRDPATLGILRQQVVALVPGAVDVEVLSWTDDGKISLGAAWRDADGYIVDRADLALAKIEGGKFWHIEALVAALEAAKENKP